MTKYLPLWSLPALAATACLTIAVCFTGCDKQAESPTVEEAVVEEVEVPAMQPGDSDQSIDANEITAAMAELSPADRTAALAQKICPVSGEPLGSMGTPIKVTADGREVFLCCEACKEKFEANPQEYLAKLDTAS